MGKGEIMPNRVVCDSNKTCFANGIDLEEKLAFLSCFLIVLSLKRNQIFYQQWRENEAQVFLGKLVAPQPQPRQGRDTNEKL